MCVDLAVFYFTKKYQHLAHILAHTQLFLKMSGEQETYMDGLSSSKHSSLTLYHPVQPGLHRRLMNTQVHSVVYWMYALELYTAHYKRSWQNPHSTTC